MTIAADLPSRIEGMTHHDRERLLYAVLDRLMDDVGQLEAEDEETARELVAAFVSQDGQPVGSDAVLRPSLDLAVHVEATLLMLAHDPMTSRHVAQAMDELPDESQMFAEPVTAALVLGILVAFLQTRFQVKVSRRAGKVDFEFSMSKKAASDSTVGKVIEAVRSASLK